MRLCLHNWARWSAPFLDHFGGEGKLLQSRECKSCGKVKLARVSQPYLSRGHLQDVLQSLRAGEKS